MRLEDIASSGLMTRLGLWLGQHLPKCLGYSLASLFAFFISRTKPHVYQTVRTNLAQVMGLEKTNPLLDKLASRVFYYAGQAYYDLFHAISQPLEALSSLVEFPPGFVQEVREHMAKGRGVLFLALHMSNFDLAGLWLGTQGLAGQILSLADPTTGFLLLNRLRALSGHEITPITPESLRAAIKRLRNGGIVITGADRPAPEQAERIPFFGRPSFFPVGPIRLALLSDALVWLGSCYRDPGRGYVMSVAGPLEMTRSGNRQGDVLANAQRIAEIAENQIRAHPDQWLMFHPFWPPA